MVGKSILNPDIIKSFRCNSAKFHKHRSKRRKINLSIKPLSFLYKDFSEEYHDNNFLPKPRNCKTSHNYSRNTQETTKSYIKD